MSYFAWLQIGNYSQQQPLAGFQLSENQEVIPENVVLKGSGLMSQIKKKKRIRI